jgi:hypothetical protein
MKNMELQRRRLDYTTATAARSKSMTEAMISTCTSPATTNRKSY